MRFPSDWPRDCPPADADQAWGEVYRLVKQDPPTRMDFVSAHEAGKFPKAPPCLRCGLSVFRDRRDAVHQRGLLPNLGRYIAGARLGAEHGKTMLTKGRQPTHTTWWAYDSVDRAALFSIVDEES